MIKIYENQAWTRIHVSPFTKNCEIHECQFFIVLSEKLTKFCVISREIAKLWELGGNRIFQFRIEVKSVDDLTQSNWDGKGHKAAVYQNSNKER